MAQKPGFIDTRTEHRALTQLHRWCELNERERGASLIARQMEILDCDVRVHSAMGESEGRDAYLRWLSSIPATDRNSHRVKSWSVARQNERISLSAEIIYQRRQQNGTMTSSALRCETTLRDSPGLPVFKEMKISPVAPVRQTELVDAYAENRVKSFLYYWLSLMEDSSCGAEPFWELLATDGFTFDLGIQELTTASEFETWLRQGASQIRRLGHSVEHLSIEEIGNREYAVSVELAWVGVDSLERTLAARVHHDWLLKDTEERFVRLKRARIEAVEPLHIVG